MPVAAEHDFEYFVMHVVLLTSVTVIEVLPKEKKQKEEKTVVLGQCTIDLLPLVKGKIRCTNI